MKEIQQYLGVLRQCAYQEQEIIKREVRINFITCKRGKIEKTVVCLTE